MLIKTVLVTAILLVLVLIGVNNNAPVDFSLPPLITSTVQKPAALMYFGFFAMGLLTGAIVSFGTRKPKES